MKHNPFRKALARYRYEGVEWMADELVDYKYDDQTSESTLTAACLLGVTWPELHNVSANENQEAYEERADGIVLLSDLVHEQYPDHDFMEGDNLGCRVAWITGVNDEDFENGQEDAERILEKAAVKWDEGEHE